LLNVTLFGWQFRCSTRGRAVLFYQDAEKVRQRSQARDWRVERDRRDAQALMPSV
jgi:hypothetical protein